MTTWIRFHIHAVSVKQITLPVESVKSFPHPPPSSNEVLKPKTHYKMLNTSFSWYLQESQIFTHAMTWTHFHIHVLFVRNSTTPLLSSIEY